MTEIANVTLMSEDEFWEKDPAPGTVFFDLNGSGLEIVGEKIDPTVDDPSNAVMITNAKPDTTLHGNTIAVVRWGDWSTEENREILRLRKEAEELMRQENG